MKHHHDVIRLACATASSGGAQPHKISVLQPASGPTQPGFQIIAPAEYLNGVNRRQVADGVILTECNSAVCIPTGDCPTLVLIHPKKVVATHAGREGLKAKSGCAGCTSNVITHALSFFTETERKETTACIVGAIAAKHFAHPDEAGQKLVAPFKLLYGDKYFDGDPTEGKLDMVRFISDLCVGYGIPANQVIWDGVDTYSNPHLASHRHQCQRDVGEIHWKRNCIIAYHT